MGRDADHLVLHAELSIDVPSGCWAFSLLDVQRRRTIRPLMLPGIVQTWTVWLSLLAVLSGSLAPRGSSGSTSMVLCVGCDRVAFTIGAPCSTKDNCCKDGELHHESASAVITAAADAGCSCMDVPFPSHPSLFTIHVSSIHGLKFVALTPLMPFAVHIGDVLPRRLRHLSAVEPPWALAPNSRATVFQI